jgi:uncharacterized protein YneF (UPF0154 family)
LFLLRFLLLFLLSLPNNVWRLMFLLRFLLLLLLLLFLFLFLLFSFLSMKSIKSYLWNRTMLNFCGIVAAILKMETGRNFSMSGINSGHHNLPTYEISLKSNIVEFVRYCGGHFENGSAIFKMSAKTRHTKWLQKFNIVRYHQNLICG